MAQEYHASSPQDLRNITERRRAQEEQSECHIRLALMNPISEPAIVAASRDYDSRYMKVSNSDGTSHRGCVTKDEYLDLSHLGKLWRTEWVAFLRSVESSRLVVTFDNTLPTYHDESGKTKGIFYEAPFAPDQGDTVYLHIERQRLNNLCITLATEARMLVKTKLELKVVLDESWGLREKMVKHLDMLSK